MTLPQGVPGGRSSATPKLFKTPGYSHMLLWDMAFQKLSCTLNYRTTCLNNCTVDAIEFKYGHNQLASRATAPAHELRGSFVYSA